MKSSGSIHSIFIATLILSAGCRDKEKAVQKLDPAVTAIVPRTNAAPANTNTLAVDPDLKFGNLSYQSVTTFVPSPAVAKKSHSDPAYKEEWNRFTTLHEYRLVGKTNSNWDASAEAALAAYAQLRSVAPNSDLIKILTDRVASQAADAIASGCDDPLLRYLYVRYVETQQLGMTDAKLSADYRAVSRAIETTRYSPIRKMYPSLRAAESFFYTGRQTPPELSDLKLTAIHHVVEALGDVMMPPSEAADICKQAWAAGQNNPGVRDYMGKYLVPAVLNNWPKESFAYLMKGQFYIQKAWDARGRGYASSVSDAGFKKFEEVLKLSEDTLKKGWELNKKDTSIPIALMDVYLGLGSKPDEDLWFQRAMEIDPACIAAVKAKSFFLQPKWYGSEQEMLEFGRECVRTKKWKGLVPLFLVDTHDIVYNLSDPSEQAFYWKKPEVWQDLRNSFERFFDENPEANGYRHNYAKAAYRCEKYEPFLEQVAQFSQTNHAYFGGQAAFDAMVKKAKSEVTKK